MHPLSRQEAMSLRLRRKAWAREQKEVKDGQKTLEASRTTPTTDIRSRVNADRIAAELIREEACQKEQEAKKAERKRRKREHRKQKEAEEAFQLKKEKMANEALQRQLMKDEERSGLLGVMTCQRQNIKRTCF